MTSEIRFIRQESLSILRDQEVAVIGVGGIGSWVAQGLALAGVRHLSLFDSDHVDESNLHRLPPGIQTGEVKAAGVQRLLGGVAHGTSTFSHFCPDLHTKALARCRWAVVCTDNLPSRRMVFELCKELGVKYIECGAEGNRATVSFSPAQWTTPEEDQLGYRSVPVFIGPCLLAASIALYYVLKDVEASTLTVADWVDNHFNIIQHEEATHGQGTRQTTPDGAHLAGRQ